MSDQTNASSGLELPTIRSRVGNSTGRQFWRSLDEAASTPEFEELVHREFPTQVAEWNDPAGRRNFLKLMAASLAFGGIGGCTRPPQEKIVPYVRAPEELVPGRPQFYATAMVRGGYALGLLVESHMGRPTKIEGNPEHPASLGATDAFAQASILTMYDPDRSQTIMRRGVIETWDTFITTMTREMEAIRERRGAGLRILTETITSPTLAGQIRALLEDLPEARWYEHQPAGNQNARQGAQQAFGREVEVAYNFRQANVVVSLDSDFLQDLPGSVRYAREFIDGRRVSVDAGKMNRLYVAESTPTITGAMAAHRLAVRPSQIETLARGILAGVRGQEPAENSATDWWLTTVVKDLRANQGAAIVVAGPGQPAAVHAIVHAINEALGSRGRTINYLEPIAVRPEQERATLADLAQEMQAGDVDTLIILGGNPVYNAPGELEFTKAMEKVRLRIHLGEYNDETAFQSHWHIPAAHYLESWSDARSFDGTASIVQPLIAPLYDGRTAHELISVLDGNPGRTAYELVQAHWLEQLGENDFANRWRRAVHDGVLPETEAQTVEVELSQELQGQDATRAPANQISDDSIEIEIRPDSTIGDGRFANNGWLQELPKPITKLTWDNVAYLSLATAERLGLQSGDVIKITVGERSIEAPVWRMSGQPDNCISLTLGYGRTRTGRVGSGIGYNAYTLLPATGGWFAEAEIGFTGDKRKLATTQNHFAMHGRDIVRVTTHEKLKQDPDHLWDHKHHGDNFQSFYPEYDYSQGNAWGMVIDQTACIGCNACVVACQSENNIPVVGKEQVSVGREMHWLRIDRYHAGEVEDPQDLETYFQPMMCVHCEKAPCEVVCPVAATVHDAEGTNNMVYNRCVGTRYCSNNCPYKVRRFNFLQYSDETTPSLKLMRNPDVTVRSRGVMEKCTYCIQRISHARIDAKKDGDGFVADGQVVTACQQACPTRAIVFGNLNDKQGEARKLKTSPLNYGVLAELGTTPRTTYLARVANPHPDLEPPKAANPEEHIADKDKAHS